MPITKTDIERYFAVGDEIQSGGGLRSFHITHILDDRIRIQPIEAKTPSRLSYQKLALVVEFFNTLNKNRIAGSVNDLLRANGLKETQSEVYLFGFARTYLEKKSTPHLETSIADDMLALKEEDELKEGGKKLKLVSIYERNPKVRLSAIEFHGTTCKACGFNFNRVYGELGKDYIEVHHLVPISTYIEPNCINPQTDLTVLCSNCHRMAHRSRERTLSVDELKQLIQEHNAP